MDEFIPIAEEVLAESDRNPDVSTKLLGETALLIRGVLTCRFSELPNYRGLLANLYKQIHSDYHLRLLDKTIDAPALAMPYAAIRRYTTRSALFESILSQLSEQGMARSECIPFKECELQFILYMADLSAPPAFGSLKWQKFCDRIFEFNSNDAYIFAHRYIYSRDFGFIKCSTDALIKAQLLFLLAQSVLWRNCDLGFELAYCLLLEGLNKEETLAVEALMYSHLKEYDNIRRKAGTLERYHEMYVATLYGVKGGSMHGVDNLGHLEARVRLLDYAKAIIGKNPQKISETYFRAVDCLPVVLSLSNLTMTRFDDLRRGAEAQTLFERECRITDRNLDARDYAIFLNRLSHAENLFVSGMEGHADL